MVNLVQDFLENTAARLPDKEALICAGQRLTYAQLESMSNRLANGLVASGVKRGDRVAIYLPNCVEAVVGIFAVLKADGVFVMINPTTKKDKLRYILNNCRARGLLTEPNTSAHTPVSTLMAEAPSLEFVVLCGKRG